MTLSPIIEASEAINLTGKAIFFDASFHLPQSERNAEAEFIGQRIKGAQRFDINAIALPRAKFPHTMPSAPIFQRQMRAMGVDQDSIVIVYDDTPLFSAARAWFMLKYFGHSNVRVLNGGFGAWKAAGGETETGETPHQESSAKSGDFIAKDPDGRCSVMPLKSLKRMVEKPPLERARHIIDARPEDRFFGRGQEPRGGLASGHIPGSQNIPFGQLIDKDTNRIKPKAELEAIFANLSDKPIVATCGSGVTACVLILGLTIIGRDNAALYDGSWSEWGSRDDCPISV